MDSEHVPPPAPPPTLRTLLSGDTCGLVARHLGLAELAAASPLGDVAGASQPFAAALASIADPYASGAAINGPAMAQAVAVLRQLYDVVHGSDFADLGLGAGE